MDFNIFNEKFGIKHTVFMVRSILASGLPFPHTSSTSARARSCQSWYLANNIKHQDAVIAVVSCPAKNIVLQLSIMNLSCEIEFEKKPSLPSQFFAPSSIICKRSCSRPSSCRCFTSLDIFEFISFSNLHICLLFLFGKYLKQIMVPYSTLVSSITRTRNISKWKNNTLYCSRFGTKVFQ